PRRRAPPSFPTRRSSDLFTLSGGKMFVPDAHLADVLVVAARSRDGSTLEDGVSLFLVPKETAGVGIRRLPSVDETRKLCEVKLEDRKSTRLNSSHGSSSY